MLTTDTVTDTLKESLVLTVDCAGMLDERRFGSQLASDTSALCWVCAGMLGERGLELVVQFPS